MAVVLSIVHHVEELVCDTGGFFKFLRLSYDKGELRGNSAFFNHFICFALAESACTFALLDHL